MKPSLLITTYIQPDNWDLDKLMAMCVKEEERLKALHVTPSTM
jgi:hypothetical protein